ncbi:MAG TPA: hypothetical protein VGK67_19955 [Myxococcales bacterium]|jgi:hypothetical protein
MFERVDRIRAHTPAKLNEDIDHCIARRIEDLATRSDAEQEAHLGRLDRTWSLDRAALAGLATVALAANLAALRRPGWRWLAVLSSASLLQAAASGSGVVVALLRRVGLRTRREIECERCAIKALRGDFELVTAAKSPIAQAGNAWQAALR